MKKIICLLLVLLLVVSVITSCGIVDNIPDAGTPGTEQNGGVTNGGNESQGNENDNTGTGNNNPGGENNDQGNENQGNPGNGNCLSKEMHIDSDNNGACDICTADVVITLDIYGINDLHGKVFDTDSQIGVDELTTYLKNAETRDEEYVFLSSGDMWQGSAESNITKGMLVTDWMSHLGFASMTLGNHEYDWGEEYIRENANVADFPFLAINVYSTVTGKRVEYCQPSVIVERGDLKIGIIGAIGDCYSSISADKTQGIYFKTDSDLTSLVKAESERLRNVENVDIIIYSIHDGYEQSASGSVASSRLTSYYAQELSSGGYVDVVFEGHTHQKYAFYDSYGVYHLQNGGDNKNGIAHVELDVNFANNRVNTNTAGIIEYTTYSSMAQDKIVDDLREKYAEAIGNAFGKVGYNSKYRDDSEIEQLTAELYYQLGIEVWGDEYDIVLGGGFLRTRSPYNLAKGDVTYSDLMMLMPFDNEIVLCSVKGSDLNRKFFNSTNDDYYIAYGAYGETVKKSINSGATYYIVVDMYTAQYSYNNLTVVATYDSNVFARDLLADYVRNGGLE